MYRLYLKGLLALFLLFGLVFLGAQKKDRAGSQAQTQPGVQSAARSTAS